MNNKNPRIKSAELCIARSLIDTISPAMILVSIIKNSKNEGLNPLVEINKKWNKIINTSLTYSKKEKLINELEILSKDLIIMCNHKESNLIETISKIRNDLKIDKTIHIKL